MSIEDQEREARRKPAPFKLGDRVDFVWEGTALRDREIIAIQRTRSGVWEATVAGRRQWFPMESMSAAAAPEAAAPVVTGGDDDAALLARFTDSLRDLVALPSDRFAAFKAQLDGKPDTISWLMVHCFGCIEQARK